MARTKDSGAEGRVWVRGRASGPFTLWRADREASLAVARRRHVALFCCAGRVRLAFGSFSYELTQGSAVAIDGRRLRRCVVAPGSEVLEYRPRDGHYHLYEDALFDRAFMTFPVDAALQEWVGLVSRDIARGKSFGRYDFCSVGVQLRDRSGGAIPWPFACSEVCPRWEGCAAVAGYDGVPCQGADAASPVVETRLRRLGTLLAAAAGMLLWGALLVYNLWRDFAAA